MGSQDRFPSATFSALQERGRRPRAVILDFYGTLVWATHSLSIDEVLAEHKLRTAT